MKKSERIAKHDEVKSVRLTRSDLIALLRNSIKKPPEGTFVVVEVEQGDDLINVNDVDALVVSWG